MTTQATTDWKNEIQRRRAVFLAIVVILLTYAISLIAFARGGLAGSGRVWLMLFQALTFILLGSRAGIGGWAISILTYICFSAAINLEWHIPGAGGDLNLLPPLLAEGVTFLLVTVALALILQSLGQRWQKALLGVGAANQQLQTQTQELEKTKRRLRQQTTQLHQLETTAEIAQAGSSILEPEKLLVEIVDRIRDGFSPIGVYYVELFLLDETQRFAILSAAAGESERPPLNVEIGSKLELNETSTVGWCITNCKTRTTMHESENGRDENAIEPDNSHAPHAQGITLPMHTQEISLSPRTQDIALLPHTQEIALPLQSRGNVLGALNLHSTQETEFSEIDIAVLQTMANQVALAIDNTYLVSQTQTIMDEVQALQRRYLIHAWQDFLTTQPVTQADYARPGTESETTPGNRAATSLRWLRREVMERGQTMTEPAQQTENSEGALMMVPLKLREQIIGTLSLRETDQQRQWTDEDIALVETIAEQVALTVENLRLMNNTQRRADRERLVGELSEQMQRASDIASLMYITAEGLNQALGGSRVFVRMGTEAELTGDTRTQAIKEPPA